MQQTQTNIEDILSGQGLLRPDQVSAVKLESVNTGKSAEKVILEHNFASPDQIGSARASAMGVPFVKLESRAIAPDVLNLIPESVARHYKLIPFAREEDSLAVAMVDPLDSQVLEFISQKAEMKIKRYLGTEEDILTAINDQYRQNLTTDVTSALEEVGASNPTDDHEEADKAEVIREAPVANIVNQLLEFAVKSNASDIHIEPQETQTRVRYRIDGILHEKIILPKKVHDAVVSRVKILSDLKIDERRLPQDGRFDFEFNDQKIDFRVSTLPTVFGEKVVLRLLPKSNKPPTLQELGLRANSLKSLDIQLLRPYGIILICGPTGSGKTTTLYSILSSLSTSRVNILTVEDPVEYQIQGVNQVQVNPAIGLTFASALRSFLRQDPNVILVGEIRDTETSELAVQAALTGHQVFSTLHTNSAAGSLPRLLDMGTEPFLLASAINAVVAQRILRKICTACRSPYNPPPEVAEGILKVLGKIAPSKLAPGTNMTLFKGVGCSQCGHTGYLGRIGIFEVLTVSVKMMDLILRRASANEVETLAIEEGMMTLKQDGYLKVLDGLTTLEEVLRVAQD